VTLKPPKTLIEAKKTPMNPQMLFPSKNLSDLSSSKHPTTIIPLIAFVTLINGVCKAGVTFQITIYPIKIARMKIKNLLSKTLCESGIRPKITNKIISPAAVINESFRELEIGCEVYFKNENRDTYLFQQQHDVHQEDGVFRA